MDRKIRITEGVKNEEKLLENELCQKKEVTGGYSSATQYFHLNSDQEAAQYFHGKEPKRLLYY